MRNGEGIDSRSNSLINFFSSSGVTHFSSDTSFLFGLSVTGAVMKRM